MHLLTASCSFNIRPRVHDEHARTHTQARTHTYQSFRNRGSPTRPLADGYRVISQVCLTIAYARADPQPAACSAAIDFIRTRRDTAAAASRLSTARWLTDGQLTDIAARTTTNERTRIRITFPSGSTCELCAPRLRSNDALERFTEFSRHSSHSNGRSPSRYAANKLPTARGSAARSGPKNLPVEH
jgi:hypothetical protein